MKGYCRRHAPQIHLFPCFEGEPEYNHTLEHLETEPLTSCALAIWPVIQDAEKDWCGEGGWATDKNGRYIDYLLHGNCKTCAFFEEIKEE